MIHISRDMEAYFRGLDKNFSSTPSASLGVRFEVEKMYSSIQDKWNYDNKRTIKGLKSFEKKLLSALSDPLPKSVVGRPRHILRKFPFMDNIRGGKNGSKNLVDTWSMEHITVNENNSTTLLLSYGFSSGHAGLTNIGYRSSRNVHWLHWADNILGSRLPKGQTHSAKVPDIRSVLLGRYGKSY